MASPSVQTAAAANGSSATPTITEPTGAAQDDLLVAVVGSADPTTAITGLSGWTQLGEADDTQGNRYWYGWIIRGASAPDLVADAANAGWVTHCLRITGHDATTPIGTDHATAAGTDNSPNPPNVDPGSSRDHLAIAATIQQGKGNTFTPPTNYTEQTDTATSGPGGPADHVAGSTATRAYTGQAEDPGVFASDTNDGWTAITVLVRPTSTGPQTITVNEFAETETAESAGIGLEVVELTETEAPQAMGIGLEINAVAETEDVQPVGIGLEPVNAGETETVQAVTPLQAQTVAVGEAIETEAAQAIAVTLSAVVNSATEAETAESVGIGLEPVAPVETEAVQAVAVQSPITVAIGEAVETESGQIVTPVLGGAQSEAVNAATETEAAQTVSFTRSMVEARPDADNVVADWDSAPVASQDLYAQIDEIVLDNNDYIFVDVGAQ